VDAGGQRCFEEIAGMQDGAGFGQPVPDPPGLSYGWSLPPAFGPDALAVYGDLRRLQAGSLVGGDRPAVANLLLLAREMGVVSDAEIQLAVGHGDALALAGLFNEASSRIGRRLEEIQRSFCAESDVLPPLDVALFSNADGCALAVATQPTLLSVPLTGMDSEEAGLVYGCLAGVARELGFGLPTGDLLEMDWHVGALCECLRAFKESGTASVAEWAALALSEGTLGVCEFYESEPDLEDALRGALDQGFTGLPEWVKNPPSLRQAEAAHKALKHSRPSWPESPWAGFVGQCVQMLKAAKKREKRARLACGCDEDGFRFESDEGDCPMDYGLFIGVGLPLEETAAQNLYEQIAGVGETPTLSLRLSPVAIPWIAMELEHIAQARGLFNLAAAISEESLKKGQPDECV